MLVSTGFWLFCPLFCFISRHSTATWSNFEFLPKKVDSFWISDFQHAIPHKSKATFVFFKLRPIHTYIVCWGLHLCFIEKIILEIWWLKKQIKCNFISNLTFLISYKLCFQTCSYHKNNAMMSQLNTFMSWRYQRQLLVSTGFWLFFPLFCFISRQFYCYLMRLFQNHWNHLVPPKSKLSTACCHRICS